MSASSHINDRPRPLITAALCAGALILGIPVAVAALMFEMTDMPNPVLGSKEIKAGIDTTKTITFRLFSGPNDAVMAGAYISIICSLLLCIGFGVTRHLSKHNIWGWLIFLPGLANVCGQVAILARVFIDHGKNKQAGSADEVPFVNGKYETDGKLYTREAWACMMDKFYADRETWANKACSDLKTGRIMTVPLVACAALILVLAVFQVHKRGGFGWLFGRKKSIAYMNTSKNEYIDLQPKH
ncbi:hypothetical protein B0J11DRAFT_493793 [Dendryphion nanum]|uniref:Uncharacterized protein n=1 Tax=Dendryphion nanum TaxID=256645 RepID=A0A9P9DEW2_9PLEO|nr:hypothetical protein B0J11DRAFT_493793 [Dendryphion nanum]